MYKIKTPEKLFFTSDEHYLHNNIIKYCNRPFSNVEEMNNTLISNHNSIVPDDSLTIHLGDFFLGKSIGDCINIINKLNGKHIFINGSHDRWLKQWNKILEKCSNKLYSSKFHDILTIKIIDSNNEYVIVCCHYAMRTWPLSHHGSWHVFGHSHCNVESYGFAIDVGVDCWNFKPVRFYDIKNIFYK